MISVKPLIKNSVPRVVMKDGIRSITVKNPLTRPTIAAAIKPDSDRGNKGNARLLREIHHERRQRVNLTHRQIDLAGDRAPSPGRPR